MSASAYVLINVQVNRVRKVYEELMKIKEITLIDAISGPFDIIVSLTAPDFNTLGKIVIDKIQSIPGVERTLTCQVIRFEP
jgi:DNA-binding Lrp family transcriptional regulator|uniref:Lrp/AsnC family transcriptional regulator n=1 Tax=candidate division WOR-3 bacterium TaxID=2052148 RepID=A0A7C3UR17_UNCW3